MKNYLISAFCFLFVAWIVFSFLGSVIKAGEGACEKNYPIDYFLKTNFFCEITEE